MAATTKEAVDDFYPGWAKVVSDIGKERGWPPMTRRDFEAQIGPEGALMIGDPDEVAEKILRHSDALGGISRVTFQMNAASLAQEKMTQAIELIGTRVAPALRARARRGSTVSDRGPQIRLARFGGRTHRQAGWQPARGSATQMAVRCALLGAEDVGARTHLLDLASYSPSLPRTRQGAHRQNRGRALPRRHPRGRRDHSRVARAPRQLERRS